MDTGTCDGGTEIVTYEYDYRNSQEMGTCVGPEKDNDIFEIDLFFSLYEISCDHRSCVTGTVLCLVHACLPTGV